MVKFERVKGTIVGFGFLCFALSLKSVYSGEHEFLFGFILVLVIVIGPTIVSHKWKPHKQKRTDGIA